MIDEDAVDAIVQQALELKTGARALRSIVERLMMDAFFAVSQSTSIKEVHITKDTVCKQSAPVMR